MTPFGISLAAALMPLCVWGTEHRAEVERAVDPLPPNHAQVER